MTPLISLQVGPQRGGDGRAGRARAAAGAQPPLLEDRPAAPARLRLRRIGGERAPYEKGQGEYCVDEISSLGAPCMYEQCECALAPKAASHAVSPERTTVCAAGEHPPRLIQPTPSGSAIIESHALLPPRHCSSSIFNTVRRRETSDVQPVATIGLWLCDTSLEVSQSGPRSCLNPVIGATTYE